MTLAVAQRPDVGDRFGSLTSGLAASAFPSRVEVEAVASSFHERQRIDGRPHAGYVLQLSTGVVGVRQTLGRGFAADWADGVEWSDAALGMEVDQELGDVSFTTAPRGRVVEWSAKSRNEMARALGELDYSELDAAPGDLALVTLTLPDEWQRVARTGRDFKRLVRAWCERYRRAIGTPRGIWKLEFQGRGAPHLHMLLSVPALVAGVPFEEWARRSWCDVVAHPDPVHRARHLEHGVDVQFSGITYSTPRRIAVYFAKHSAKSSGDKEYQHTVPVEWQEPGAGPGRFWGVWGVTRVRVEVEISKRDAVRVARMLRKLARARDARMALARAAAAGLRAPVVARGKTRHASDLSGWVLFNDATGVGYAILTALSSYEVERRCSNLGGVQRAPEVVSVQLRDGP